jgi:hypothetical protein
MTFGQLKTYEELVGWDVLVTRGNSKRFAVISRVLKLGFKVIYKDGEEDTTQFTFYGAGKGDFWHGSRPICELKTPEEKQQILLEWAESKEKIAIKKQIDEIYPKLSIEKLRKIKAILEEV